MSDAPTQVLTSPIDRIYDWVELSVPGVLHPVVQAAVFSALEEFCSRSTYWRIPVTWTMPVGVDTLDFNNPPILEGVRTRWLLNPCGLICPVIQPQAVLIDGSGDTTQERTGSVTLVCVPTKLSTVLPDWFDDWSEQIQAGVLQRLYMQPAKPYSNIQLAQAVGRQFRVGIQLARVEAQRMVARGPVPYPYFAKGRQGAGLIGNECCCVGGGSGTGPTPPDPPVDPTLPVAAISPGVISDQVISDPVAMISLAVISDAPTGGSVTPTPDPLVFPTTALGTTSEEVVTFENTSSNPVTVIDATITGDFAISDMSKL